MTTQPPAPRSRTLPRVVSIATIAFGGAVLVGTLWSGAAPTLAAASSHEEGRTLDTDGVGALDLDVSAASFTIRFDDVDEAALDVRDAGNGSWTLREQDGTLFVQSPDRPFLSWFGTGNGDATLTLPRDLEGLATDIDFGAGRLDAEGDFGDLDIEIGAGQVDVSGSATALTVQLGAGRGDLDLEGVRTANLEVSAGALVGRLTGAAPDEIDLAVSAGSLELTVPDDEYDIDSEVAAGDFTHDLRTADGAAHRLSVEVSAGDARVSAE